MIDIIFHFYGEIFPFMDSNIIRLDKGGDCWLLLETDLTNAEVSYDSGFADPKYFSRCFKKSTGLSPSEYKNQRS